MPAPFTITEFTDLSSPVSGLDCFITAKSVSGVTLATYDCQTDTFTSVASIATPRAFYLELTGEDVIALSDSAISFTDAALDTYEVELDTVTDEMLVYVCENGVGFLDAGLTEIIHGGYPMDDLSLAEVFREESAFTEAEDSISLNELMFVEPLEVEYESTVTFPEEEYTLAREFGTLDQVYLNDRDSGKSVDVYEDGLMLRERYFDADPFLAKDDYIYTRENFDRDSEVTGYELIQLNMKKAITNENALNEILGVREAVRVSLRNITGKDTFTFSNATYIQDKVGVSDSVFAKILDNFPASEYQPGHRQESCFALLSPIDFLFSVSVWAVDKLAVYAGRRQIVYLQPLHRRF